MTKTKIFFHNISPLNIGLILFLIIFITSQIIPILKPSIHDELPPVGHPPAPGEKHAEKFRAPALSDYMNVAEKNIFHPERKIPVEKEGDPVSPPLPKPDVILYGTLITDDMRIAYLEDLKSTYSTRGRGRRQLALRKGDTLSGFTLQEIDVNKIVMVRGQEKLIVKIHEKKQPDNAIKPSVTPALPVKTKPEVKPRQLESARQPEKPLKQSDQDIFNFFKKREPQK
jgi:hypothetical protein